MTFTAEQIESIEKLAGLNYSVKQIAMYLDVHPSEIQHEFDNRESEFRYRYDRGRMIAQADIDQKLLDAARGANLTAITQFEKIRQARRFENMRDQLINGH